MATILKFAVYALIGALVALGLRSSRFEALPAATPVSLSKERMSAEQAVQPALRVSSFGPAAIKAAGAYSLDIFRQYAPPPEWILEGGVIGPEFVSAEIADFTGDGRDDIATIIAGASAENHYLLYLLPQLPSGELGGAIPYPLSAADNGPYYNIPFATAVGDFNEDGIKDLVLTRGRGISLLVADGQGGFRNSSYTADRAFDVPSVVLDVNRDGHLDVVSHSALAYGEIGDPRSRLVIHYGDGFGGIAAHTSLYTFGSVEHDSEKAYSLTTGDLNSDGFPDLALRVTEYDYQAQIQRHPVLIYLHDGQQGYRPVTKINSVLTTGMELLMLNKLVVADFTHDGLDDLVATAESVLRTEVHVYAQKPDGTLESTARVKSSYHSATALDVGDLDNDGYNDLLVAHSNQDRIGYLLQGLDGLQNQVFRYTGGGGPSIGPTSQAIGDLNGDGCADAVVVAQWHAMTVLHGSGCSIRPRYTGGNSQPMLRNGLPATLAAPVSTASYLPPPPRRQAVYRAREGLRRSAAVR